MIAHVDLVILTRGTQALPAEVEQGIRSQAGVNVRVHRVVGSPEDGDSCRWDAIVRARNAGKSMGAYPLLMYLDDDVVLHPTCMRKLVDAIGRNGGYAAVAADYLGENGGGFSRHVAMGATLFRRAALERIHFRWEPGRCECQCCCDDMRSQLMGICYVAEAKAWHRKATVQSNCHHSADSASSGLVLAAFNRAHYRGFRERFLRSLRRSGNQEPVTAVTYGLYPSEVRSLATMPGVDVVALDENGVSPAIRRLYDFQNVLAKLPRDACVAYWDAADVWFQSTLTPLWNLVRTHRGKLLVVSEPRPSSVHPTIYDWTYTIFDEESRKRVYSLLRRNPFLNAGFAGGTAEAMLRYFQAAHDIRHSSTLTGTEDWGDQIAMNVYCHTHPERRELVSDDWNYLLVLRDPKETRLRPDGKFTRADGTIIPVVHGAAKRLEPFWFARRIFGPSELFPEMSIGTQIR